MCMQTENAYALTFVLSSAIDDIKIDLISYDFAEPSSEEIEDIVTTKHLLYYLFEVFGENAYEYIDQDMLDELEEIEFEDINEIHITDKSAGLVYYINIHQKTIDKEYIS